MSADREAFERWARNERQLEITRSVTGGYYLLPLDLAWAAWQAATKRAQRVPIGNFILGRDGMPQAVSFYPEHFDKLILERGTVPLYAIVKAPGIPATPAGGAK